MLLHEITLNMKIDKSKEGKMIYHININHKKLE